MLNINWLKKLTEANNKLIRPVPQPTSIILVFLVGIKKSVITFAKSLIPSKFNQALFFGAN